MKVLTNSAQQRLIVLIHKAHESAICDDACKVTDLLEEIAEEVLTYEQLCALRIAEKASRLARLSVLKDELCNKGGA